MSQQARCPAVQSVSTSLPRIPELDGVRGVAILLVIAYHFGNTMTGQSRGIESAYRVMVGLGWTGVDLFFVLSGFLITRILLNTKQAPHYFKSFYVRKVLRIFPLYYLCILLFFDCLLPLSHFVPYHVGLSFTAHRAAVPEQFWYWLYVSNWRTAFGPDAYSSIGHLWSLAIEEQFYLVWPLVVFLVDESSLVVLCATLIAISFGLRSLPPVQAIQATHPEFVYRLTPFRMEPLLFGALIALLERRHIPARVVRTLYFSLPVVGAAGIVAAVRLGGTTEYSSDPMSTFGFTSVALLFSSVILYAINHSASRSPGAWLLRSPLLTQCGKYSYAMYLFQTPFYNQSHITQFLNRLHFLGQLCGSLLSIVIGAGASYLAARCSWWRIESRFLRLKGRFLPD